MVREYEIKGFQHPIQATGALDLMRKIKSMSPMFYDVRDREFITAFCTQMKLEIPNPVLPSDHRAKLVLAEMLKNGTAKALKNGV